MTTRVSWRGSRRVAAFFALVALALFPVCAALAAVPSVYLVQNSGWMEPFFADPASPFKPLLKALVDASNTGRTLIASFNQDGQVPGHHSPEKLFDDTFAPGKLGSAIDQLGLAVRPGGRLADADFEQALVRSLDGLLDNKPGIVWMVTNNKNSRNNDPRIDANTRRFAELIRNSVYLPLVVAYPLRMPVTGRLYTERGLIIYAFAYGDEAAAELAQVIQRPTMRDLFTDPPFKLKHLDQAPLSFSANGGQAPVQATNAPDGSLILTGVPPEQTGPMRVSGTLRSDYYPQTIVGADLSLAWKSLDGVEHPDLLPIGVEPPTLSRLAAGGQQNVTLVITLPPTPRPPGLAGLFAQTKLLHGVLELRLSHLQLALGDDFVAKMKDVSALDQLPDVFSDYQAVTAATALLPATFVIHFSPWPLIAAITLAAISLLVLVGLVLLLARPRRYAVPVDGRNRPFELRPFQSTVTALPNNRVLRVTGRLIGRHRAVVTDQDRKPPR